MALRATLGAANAAGSRGLYAYLPGAFGTRALVAVSANPCDGGVGCGVGAAACAAVPDIRSHAVAAGTPRWSSSRTRPVTIAARIQQSRHPRSLDAGHHVVHVPTRRPMSTTAAAASRSPRQVASECRLHPHLNGGILRAGTTAVPATLASAASYSAVTSAAASIPSPVASVRSFGASSGGGRGGRPGASDAAESRPTTRVGFESATAPQGKAANGEAPAPTTETGVAVAPEASAVAGTGAADPSRSRTLAHPEKAPAIAAGGAPQPAPVGYFGKWRGEPGAKPPPRPPLSHIAWTGTNAAVGIASLAVPAHYGLIENTDLILLVAPFGASASLIYGVPDAPFSQPRNVVGGHVWSALVGAAAHDVLEVQMDLGWHVAGPVAVAGAAMGMQAFRVMHPPAAATALLAVLGSGKIHDLGYSFAITPMFTGSLALCGVGVVMNNLSAKRRYPKYW